jgi:hypothetical protein
VEDHAGTFGIKHRARLLRQKWVKSDGCPTSATKENRTSPDSCHFVQKTLFAVDKMTGQVA